MSGPSSSNGLASDQNPKVPVQAPPKVGHFLPQNFNYLFHLSIKN